MAPQINNRLGFVIRGFSVSEDIHGDMVGKSIPSLAEERDLKLIIVPNLLATEVPLPDNSFAKGVASTAKNCQFNADRWNKEREIIGTEYETMSKTKKFLWDRLRFQSEMHDKKFDWYPLVN